jgi:hypothetical protein
MIALSPHLPGPLWLTPPNSAALRRSITMDAIRDTSDGLLHLGLYGRDAWIGNTQNPLPTAEIFLSAHDRNGGTISTQRFEPPSEINLVGVPLMRGFRAACASALAQEPLIHSLQTALLAEVPELAVISLYAQMRDSVPHRERLDGDLVTRINVCSGWSAGGELAIRSRSDHEADILMAGPYVDRPEPTNGWHYERSAPAGTVRRRRRIDVVHQADRIVIQAHQRDTFVELDLTETVFHEWVVDASVDPETFIVVDIAASPRVLPGAECPRASDSTAALIGLSIFDARVAMANLPATSTCTHLNGTIRSIADASDLIAGRNRPANRSAEANERDVDLDHPRT